MSTHTDKFHDLIDRWEELYEQGQEPRIEELCQDAPHLVEQVRDWIRVLKMSDWMCRAADEVAAETLGEPGNLTAEERDRHRTLGKYTLLEELGSGGMGRVFRAIHRDMNRQVAIKLLPDSSQSDESLARFHRETQALAGLSHPNIVAIHDADEADGTCFYVMELLHGDDLARLVDQHGPMPVEQALDCVLQTARGLEYAHAQGIVHRDIKPSNLILDHDGTLKILDLGIARIQPQTSAPADDLTKTGYVMGTVDYMAPEQAMNTRRADHRADIYSLGCTLYFLLSGQPLYGGDTVMERLVAHREHPLPSLRKACPAAPAWLEAVYRKMVAKRPEDRYQSATALVSDLQRHAAPRNERWLRLCLLGIISMGLIGALAVAAVMLSSRVYRGAALPSPEQKRNFDLPVKPTWRMTGEYPLIAGVWAVAENQGAKVTIVQHGSDFVATASYQRGDLAVNWRAEGRVSHNGYVKMSLVHTHPHPPDEWKPQSRTAVLNPDGKSLEGYAVYDGGGHKFAWTLMEPHAAEEQGK
jgi:serine/threonine protein kinase